MGKVMVKVLIGCPVYKREWILPDWFAAIENQNYDLSDLGFIFELGPNDKATHNALFEWHAKHPEVFCFDVREDGGEKHDHHPEDKRIWNWAKYHKMVNFRNSLLERVNCINPDRYFSLDSDILLRDPNTISTLVELTHTRDAVSTLAYMTPRGTAFPSIMSWVNEVGGNARRDPNGYDIGSVIQADIIMASKMMTPQVFKSVRYEWHPKGEDLGWSAECTRHGFKLYCATNLYTPHIMHKWMLNEYKREGDPRA